MCWKFASPAAHRSARGFDNCCSTRRTAIWISAARCCCTWPAGLNWSAKWSNPGQLVLADRFISSTLAYQGTAGGIAVADILRVGQIALRQVWPDLVVIFDVDQRTAMARMNPLLREREFDTDLDRMEQKGAAFHARVRQGYLDQAQSDPKRHLIIDARPDVETVWQNLCEELQQLAG